MTRVAIAFLLLCGVLAVIGAAAAADRGRIAPGSERCSGFCPGDQRSPP